MSRGVRRKLVSGPLDGVRVVELGVWIAGPAASGILADWGAEVIKIEPHAGDPSRMFRYVLGSDMPTNPIFEQDNRSKRSVVLDLRQQEAAEIARELIDDADVFVTNVRAGGLERLGLAWEDLKERNPRLIYCQISGYGLEGPDAGRPAYDVAAFWSRAGIAQLLTQPGARPPFQRGGMGDHNAGLAGAAAVSAALYEREKSGMGQQVSTSLLREGMYTISFDLNAMLMWGLPIGLGDRTTTGNPAMNNYEAGDGRRFWVTGLEGPRHWPPLCHALGRPEWLDDERFATPEARRANAVELIGAIDEIFLTKPLDEWAAIFDATDDFIWAPIQSLEDLMGDPQAWAGGGYVDVPDGVSTTTMVATPADFGRTEWAPRSLAPELGEHTDDVLRELGRSAEDIAALRDSGAIG